MASVMSREGFPCSVCTRAADFSCSCVKPRLFLCSEHTKQHNRTAGKHKIRPEGGSLLQAKGDSSSDCDQFISETVDWMIDKLTSEHSRMSDTMHQHYCDCTASIYQIFQMKIAELHSAYESIRESLVGIKALIGSRKNNERLTTFIPFAAHVREVKRPFLDVLKQANLRVSIMPLQEQAQVSLDMIFEDWGLLPCGCERCFDLAATYSHKNRSELTPAQPGCCHYPSEKTYKVYQCCKRQYLCWMCHDQWEKHERLPLLREVCVKCGQAVTRQGCTWCTRVPNTP